MRIPTLLLLGLLLPTVAGARNDRPASPPGAAATQVGGSWTDDAERPSYQNGKWIEILYSRPILRQRENIFGAGEDFGTDVEAGAPVWRVGANQCTRLRTEVPLVLGDTVVPAGEYTLFVDFASPTEWTFIVSDWEAQESYDPNDEERLWGAYGYTPEKDVVRVSMTVTELPMRIDQLTIGFFDVTREAGNLAIWWDRYQASVPFRVAP